MNEARELGKLRLGMPVDALARVMGDEWSPPGPRDKGRYAYKVWGDGVGPDLPFMARITTDGTLGSLGYYGKFPTGVAIGDVAIGMSLDATQAVYPEMEADAAESSTKYEIDAYKVTRLDGDIVSLRFKKNILVAVLFERPGSAYPIDELSNRYTRVPGLQAYELKILPRIADRGSTDNNGWCFGLPPGITPAQWPLDPRTGHPMRHAFTLLLPEGYRCKGPDLVAIAVFDSDWAGNLAPESAAVMALWDAPDGAPDDPELLPVWQHRTGRHAREYRFEDELGALYAVVWLTRAEFDGPLCQPPLHRTNKTLQGHLLPIWTEIGAAAAYVKRELGSNFDGPPEQYFVIREIGGVPAKTIEEHRALRWIVRDHDPNAGVPPPEGDLFDQESAQGYKCIWSEARDEKGLPTLHPWAEAFTETHIGGTMKPYQAHPSPAFSPFFIGLTEAVGGFNFGGGTAQLDLDQVRIDWAC